MVKRCVLCLRSNYKPGITMHRFPMNKEIRAMWFDICGLNKLIDDVKNVGICSLHFKPEDYIEPNWKNFGGAPRLKSRVVPTVSRAKKKVQLSNKPIATLPSSEYRPSTSAGDTEDAEQNEETLSSSNQQFEFVDVSNVQHDFDNKTDEASIKIEAVDIKSEEADSSSEYVDVSYLQIIDNSQIVSETNKQDTSKEIINTRHVSEQINQVNVNIETMRVKSSPLDKVCDICNKSFKKSGDLRRHRHTHSEEKHVKCAVCDKAFANTHNLARHKLIHRDDKPYKCDVCNKGFTQSNLLARHRLIHTGEKPYKCHVCNKGFTQSSDVAIHNLVHTGEKPYKCDVCDKGFTSSSNLATHKLIHTGEKSYKCEVCDRGFGILAHLRRHKFTHERVKPYSCDVCGKGFITSNHLARHQLTHVDLKH